VVDLHRVGVGQLLVCLIFGEIVSQFPISAVFIPGARLVGKRWAWMAGWIYGGALLHHGGRGAVSLRFLAQLFGLESTPIATTAIASSSLS